jgi:hypothetical protein
VVIGSQAFKKIRVACCKICHGKVLLSKSIDEIGRSRKTLISAVRNKSCLFFKERLTKI